MKKFRHPESRKGTVLFLVLLFLAVVSVIVVSMAARTQRQLHFVDMEQGKLKARLACFSGYQWGLNRLLTGVVSPVEILGRDGGPLSPRVFLDGEAISLETSRWGLDREVSISFQDSSGLVNVLAVPPPVVRDWLQREAKIPVEDAAKAVDLMLDWMDPDDLSRISGGESDLYVSAGKEPPVNRLFDDVSELRMVHGLTPATLRVLRSAADFSVSTHGVNPNSSPFEVLRLFPGLTEEKITAIVTQRRRRFFSHAEELTKVTGYDFQPYVEWLDFFTSRSVYVTIKSELSGKRVFFIKTRIGLGRTIRGVNELRSSWLRMLPPDEPSGLHLHRWQEGSSGN